MAAPPILNWQAQILKGIGAPVTPQNLLFLNDWARAEGGSAANNPFNTTQGAPGATAYNSNGGNPVKNYTSPLQGLSATVQTLKNGRYGNIIGALKQGTSAQASAQALAGSPWGTGSLVLKMLGGGGAAPAAVAPAGRGIPTPQQPGNPNASNLAALIASTNESLGLGTSPQLAQLLTSRLAAAPQPAGPATRPAAGSSGYVLPVEGKIMRLDQGIDYQGTPGQPVRSIGPGHVDYVKPDPGGFGQAIYETITSGPLQGQQVYVGHAQPNVKPGQNVSAGSPLATLLRHGLGNAGSLPGWAEVGLARGGVPLSSSPANTSAAKRFQKLLYPGR